MANEKRLIYANALKRQFIDYVRTPPHFHYGDWKNMCINGTEIDEVIANAPTVDAVEVVHGQWKRRLVDWSAPYSWKVECSNCDFDICGLGDAVLFKYCPNCGAKMDGDVNG